MKDQTNEEFLQEQLAHLRAEAENFRLQADTALKYSEQVWWSWDLRRKRLKIRAIEGCILGYPQEDMERGEQFWWEKIHPEDFSDVEASLMDCFERRTKTWRCEHRLMDRAGDWVWVEQSGFVLHRDPEGNPEEMVGTTRKIQERYQLLDLFRGSEALLEAFLSRSPIYCCLRDQEGVVLLCSHAMKKLLGTDPRSCSMEDLTDGTTFKEWQSAFHTALQGNHSDLKIRLKCGDGEHREFTQHLIPVIHSGDQPFAVLEVFTRED